MAPKKSVKNRLVAKLVSGKRVPCAFCQREIDDEITCGKLYTIGDIQCHYFCVLLSSCLIQKGKDEDGLFGFLYEDIIAEVERSKKHRCSYCSRGGASLGCSVVQCKKQFHLPCGRERNAVSLFYGNYKSFCEHHAPKQSIPGVIMSRAKIRMAEDKKLAKKRVPDLKLELSSDNSGNVPEAESVCVICYEQVQGYPTPQTFWPPCCARDAWFHRNCLQRMALSAGVHYLKCPLCNDKENFYEAVVTQGYYVPDRDAAWELEQNAFSEIYERPVSCSAVECSCTMGRSHDDDNGPWCIKLCILCGSSGAHTQCLSPADTHHVCSVCTPAAPQDLQSLANSIEAVIISEEQRQATTRTRRGPVMPSRMSLRRTKRNNTQNTASCSWAQESTVKMEVESKPSTQNTIDSRQDLNLKTPKRPSITLSHPQKTIDPINSPLKLLEEGVRNKLGRTDVIDETVMEQLRRKFRQPKPLSKKKKIINDILNGLFDNLLKEPKQKEPVKEWCSPKKCSEVKEEVIQDPPTPTLANKREITPISTELKTEPIYHNDSSNSTFELPAEFIAESSNEYPPFNTPKKLKTIEIQKDSSLEISEKDQTINIDVFKIDTPQNDSEGCLKDFSLKSPLKTKKCSFKFSPFNKEVLDNNIDIDIESFKNHYLNEVARIKGENPEKSSAKIRKKRKKNSDKIVLKYKRQRKKRKNVSITNKDIKVKIKWKKEQLKLKITDSNKKKSSIRKKDSKRKLKQYILKYSPVDNSKIAKPDIDVTPMKRKYIKQEKTPDNLVQTSIERFFSVKPAKE